MSDLDALLAAYKTDPAQLSPLLEEITRNARLRAGKIESRLTEEDREDVAQEVAIKMWRWLPRSDEPRFGWHMLTVFSVNRPPSPQSWVRFFSDS